MRSTKDLLRKDNKSEMIINKALGNQTVQLIFGLILKLMSDQKKDTIDHIEQIKEILELQPGDRKEVFVQSQLMLRRYCKYFEGEENKRTIMKSNGQLVY